MRLYDTRSKSVVPIVPATPGLLRMYACGPTVYRDAHVGNMRTFLLADVIRRTAEWEGTAVILVQNITDVGHMVDDAAPADTDKVLIQAAREGRSALTIARDYEARFHRDLSALNIRPAEHYPRASESIDLMVDLIARLMDSGHAYVGSDGSVYFDARSFPGYGELSGNRLDSLRPGLRSDGELDPAKRFHADWALWKKAPSDRTQLVWDTPWAVGFPGWHTECSAMSLALLGDSIDVHTGGIDLRFPHHEDERAQSNSATGKDVVRHWVHGEHLLFEGRKMSKSSGNVVLVSDVIARGLDPLALRFVFLQNRYRQQMNLTWDTLEAADVTLTKWRQRVAQWATSPSAAMPDAALAPIRAAITNDLDTPRAITLLRELEKSHDIPAGAAFEVFAYVDRVLGLDLTRLVGRPQPKAEPLPLEISDLLSRRNAARAAKDWAASDALRDEIAALGYAVKDTAEGQVVEH